MRTTLTFALVVAAVAIAHPEPAAADDPALGATTYTTYEAWLSPAQEPGEESEVPKPLEKTLGATKPSTLRAERASRGHGRIRFTKDLTKALVEVDMKGVDPADIVMFHIHCGPPGGLGPILVDLGKFGDLTKIKGGKFTAEIINADLTYASMLPRGFKFKLPESCPVEVGFPVQVKTISGMEYLARKGVLYFNLHTKAHTFYGEMRGQIYAK
jgi:hypothetical protein